MGLLKSKPKMPIEEFCKSFYDSQIFLVNKDYWAFTLDSLKQQITEADQSFSSVDTDLFWHEWTALRMVLFTSAFTIRVKLKLEYMVREVIFTKRYLEQIQRGDLWFTLLDYNDVIDHSVFMKADGQSAEKDSAWNRGRFAFLVEPRDANMDSRWARGRVTFMNSYRFGLFKEWIKNNAVDPQSLTDEEKEKSQCLSIALKGVGADIRQADCVGVKLLASRLMHSLGFVNNLNAKAKFIIASFVFGLYTGVENHLKSVTLQ